jgi:hypothetical protein
MPHDELRLYIQMMGVMVLDEDTLSSVVSELLGIDLVHIVDEEDTDVILERISDIIEMLRHFGG